MTSRRKFLKTAGIGGAAVLAAPAIVKAQAPIKWRLQTYAGGALGEHVTKPMVDFVNSAANGEMEIELFFADQIVPTGELFQALQRGT
ncbi:MAG: twin-arginine translocation signal domain-containing protein, partial [Hyphomicrobiales bacterium]|nr:twin-arginine translocation signal domain-containing protein [Hyphomicrobiales bacterium]